MNTWLASMTTRLECMRYARCPLFLPPPPPPNCFSVIGLVILDAQEKLGSVFPPPPSTTNPFSMCNLAHLTEEEEDEGGAEDLASQRARRKRKKTKKQHKILEEGAASSCRPLQSLMENYLSSQGKFHVVGGTTEKYGDASWDDFLRGFFVSGVLEEA